VTVTCQMDGCKRRDIGNLRLLSYCLADAVDTSVSSVVAGPIDAWQFEDQSLQVLSADPE
jgi:hypothetical protein